jgi:hypothetical protein
VANPLEGVAHQSYGVVHPLSGLADSSAVRAEGSGAACAAGSSAVNASRRAVLSRTPERKTTPPGGLHALMAGDARTIEKLRKELESERAAHEATLKQFMETAHPVGRASALG